MKVVWSPRAIRRTTEIAKHIAKDNPIAAERWVDAIFDKADAIPPFPSRATQVPESTRSDVREVYHGKYRIIFRFDDHTIDVLTVRHLAQKLRRDDIPNPENDE